MIHSKYYEKVKSYYDTNRWTRTMVRNAVVKQWITKDEYEEIVREIY